MIFEEKQSEVVDLLELSCNREQVKYMSRQVICFNSTEILK